MDTDDSLGDHADHRYRLLHTDRHHGQLGELLEQSGLLEQQLEFSLFTILTHQRA